LYESIKSGEIGVPTLDRRWTSRTKRIPELIVSTVMHVAEIRDVRGNCPRVAVVMASGGQGAIYWIKRYGFGTDPSSRREMFVLGLVVRLEDQRCGRRGDGNATQIR